MLYLRLFLILVKVIKWEKEGKRQIEPILKDPI